MAKGQAMLGSSSNSVMQEGKQKPHLRGVSWQRSSMEGVSETRNLEPDQRFVAMNICMENCYGVDGHCVTHRSFLSHYDEQLRDGIDGGMETCMRSGERQN